ncbi:hypothetical protein HYH03_002843 [Edaphochlamys debaryana]|uniref:Uncharacterized protein n=1 Tax=Edaphochlamys debaryana TaxID=47281 RepID=A0A835YIK0_9CHLO|nr:hypothetical protein HYH03_002843 [Edaphochlamys debaryana]|eukprot:KAG2499265.1 hypothetical protein HYH03_002843 [Edaphochlamys debaryana]
MAPATAWSTCALSSQPLRDPIVACGLGRLYNKEAALQFLLAKKGVASKPEELLQYANQLRAANGALDHVSGMKDLLELHLTPAAPEHEGSGRSSAAAAGGAAGAGPSGAAMRALRPSA